MPLNRYGVLGQALAASSGRVVATGVKPEAEPGGCCIVDPAGLHHIQVGSQEWCHMWTWKLQFLLVMMKCFPVNIPYFFFARFNYHSLLYLTVNLESISKISLRMYSSNERIGTTHAYILNSTSCACVCFCAHVR